ncbi:respiratory chain complex I subunit 1 family protein [Thermincola ferriacetica]
MKIILTAFNLLIFPGFLFALGFGLFLAGVDRKLAARIQRRVGPPLYQPFIDLVKLMRKETVIPRAAHPTAFQYAPLLGIAGLLAAIPLMPLPGVYAGLRQPGDLLIILYLLALPALALMIGGSSSGSPFGALGLSREMMMMAYEIPLLIVLVTVALKVGLATGGTATFSLSKIVEYQLNHGPLLFDYRMLPAALAFLAFIPGTVGVVPFDIPEAETEILEGPLLEYSGPGLALFKIVNSLKLVVVLTLAVLLFYPSVLGVSPLLNLLWFMAKCVVLMICSITLVRTTTARLRIDQAFKFYLTVPAALALVSLILILFKW